MLKPLFSRCVVRNRKPTSVNSFITDSLSVMRTSKFFIVGLLTRNLTDSERLIDLPGGLMR